MSTHSDMMMIRFRFFFWVKMKLEQQNELSEEMLCVAYRTLGCRNLTENPEQ